MKSLLILTFFFFVGLSIAQNCNQNNCYDCVTQGCGYCAFTKTCLPGTQSGPTNSSLCFDHWVYGVCPPCNTYQTCAECLADTDCAWGSNGGCTLVGIPPLNGGSTVSSCPCSEYQNCRQCGSSPGCTWCTTSNNATCIEVVNNSTCQSSTTYCSCQQNQDCTSCLNDFDCYWCDDVSVCQDDPDNCFLAHTCPQQQPPKFSPASFIGGVILGMCLLGMVGGCVLYCMWSRKRRQYQPI